MLKTKASIAVSAKSTDSNDSDSKSGRAKSPKMDTKAPKEDSSYSSSKSIKADPINTSWGYIETTLDMSM